MTHFQGINKRADSENWFDGFTWVLFTGNHREVPLVAVAIFHSDSCIEAHGCMAQEVEGGGFSFVLECKLVLVLAVFDSHALLC